MIILALAPIMAILSLWIAQLIHFAISRKREFLADSRGDANALHVGISLSFAQDCGRVTLEVANKPKAHLCIVNCLKHIGRSVNEVVSTKPPIEERIAALDKI